MTTEGLGTDRLDAAIAELGLSDALTRAANATVARSLSAGGEPPVSPEPPERLIRLGVIHERRATSAYLAWIASGEDAELREARHFFGGAFDAWESLAGLRRDVPGSSLFSASIDLDRMITQELSGEPLSPALTSAFRLAVSGVVSQRTADVRLQLKDFSQPLEPATSWRDMVLEHVFVSLILLVRKGDGWRDVQSALDRISALRDHQSEFEAQYIDGIDVQGAQTEAAVELVGLYHLAQMVTLVGDYLKNGVPAVVTLRARLDRHHDRATTALDAGPWPLVAHLADLAWVCCRELVSNAIWTHVSGLGDRAKDFASLLAGENQNAPVLELWPSQQEALRRNLLDPYPRALLVEMPTSAGKTLLAKFSIVQTLALSPGSTIVYLVPTRALVNQITRDLRSDFKELGLRVEQTIPAYELDPVENSLLSDPPDVLVATPEKFDLLVRRNHPATERLSMVVVDEAHGLQDRQRGARLELVLGTVKRDRPNVRFLLLSPFLPNDQELTSWLGDDRVLPPIRVNWKPGRKVVGAVQSRGRASGRRLVLETLAAATSSELPPGLEITLGPPAAKETVADVSKATVDASVRRGSVLILCRGPGTASKRAVEIAESRAVTSSSERRDAVCRFLDAEVGHPSKLTYCIKRGVAYHHSGLSSDARWLIESLVKAGEVSIVCGTTTLAQGVNFPITTVIIETLKKGNVELSYSDFWNIAGRAGRALVDPVGVVAFPATTADRRRDIDEFLHGEAELISSQLAALVARADELTDQFTLKNIREIPELSSLLQFLAHAMRVAGPEDLADEVEDLLRASLIFHQTQRESPDRAQALVRLCRSYLNHIAEMQRGTLALADSTGFATPSVLWMMGQTQDFPILRSSEAWQPRQLFGQDLEMLTQCIDTIGGLPEVRLSEGKGGPFDPERIAQILRDWVNGASLGDLASRYGHDESTDEDQRVAAFTRYLHSQLLTYSSWGLGALESVCLPTDDDIGDAAYVPSMVYFGVSRPEAVWLRMVGLPRVAADGLGALWHDQIGTVPESYDELRGWISELPDASWESAVGTAAEMSANDLRILWGEFVG